MTNQVSVEDTYKARYDVTILINGLPLVQVELKRRGIDINEAFNRQNVTVNKITQAYSATYKCLSLVMVLKRDTFLIMIANY